MGKQDGSRMIVACETHACLRGGSGGMSHPPPPPKKNIYILNLDPLRLLQAQSGTRLLFNTCDKSIITILKFKISGGDFQGPPPSI